MNKELQRIKIAEALGWQLNPIKHTAKCLDWLQLPTGEYAYNPPDYLNDLNAMHEAEKVLTAEQRRSYVNCIFNLPVSECESNTFATAAQRAKAFLRALNLWEP